MAKALGEGETCTLIGHFIENDYFMGRTLVIDLEAPIYNRFRQVDHRTIQSIILRNVKYTLGRKSTLKDLELPKEEPRYKWDVKKLQVGNWFSEN